MTTIRANLTRHTQFGPLYGTSDIPMSSGTIMQGGRATGYYSTFGNQTTIIQPGKAPVYIDSYPY